jgi:hypothetical protein
MIMVTIVVSITIWTNVHKTVSAVGLLAPASPQSPANALGCEIIAGERGLGGRKFSAALKS